MINDKEVALITWIAENVQIEPLSGIMPGGPIWNVNAVALLDIIQEIYQLNGLEMGQIYNPVRERIEIAHREYMHELRNELREDK
jgi:hypothetical protein